MTVRSGVAGVIHCARIVQLLTQAGCHDAKRNYFAERAHKKPDAQIVTIVTEVYR